MTYCGFINICWIPIFVDFVEDLNHEFKSSTKFGASERDFSPIFLCYYPRSCAINAWLMTDTPFKKLKSNEVKRKSIFLFLFEIQFPYIHVSYVHVFAMHIVNLDIKQDLFFF